LTVTLIDPGVVPLAGVAVSHEPPLTVVLVVVKLRAAPLLLVDTLCAAGAAPPACAVNDRVVGLSVKLTGAAVTVKVTATVRGLFPAAAAATDTVPAYVPAARPAGLTDTLIEPGVVPEAGEAVSQDPPLVVELVVVKLKAAPLLLVETLCAAGAAPPACAVNDNVVGASVRVGAAATVSDTGIVKGLFEAPADVTVTFPL
jgi:hypothetical protein